MPHTEPPTIRIQTQSGSKPVTAIQAAQHAARRAATKAQIRDHFSVTEPSRGTIGDVKRLAGRIYDQRSGQRQAPAPRSLEQRLRDHKCRLTLRAIRGQRVSTPTGWYSGDLNNQITDDVGPVWVLHSSGWYEYSRSVGSYYQAASYFAGYDDGHQLFALRIPSTITDVDSAREWIKPATVRDAEAKGRPIKRQGSVYFIAKRLSSHDFSALDSTRHEIRPRKDGGLTIVHPTHPPVILGPKHTWRAYPCKSLTDRR